MNIDFEKIKKELPKSYEKLISSDNVSFGDDNNVYISTPYFREICFCDFVEFFDSEGIYIDIFCNQIHKKLCPEKFTWQIQTNKLYPSKKTYNARPEAQVEAVYVAFKIMESIQ